MYRAPQTLAPRTGPIHRCFEACYDCAAAPGQRHTTICDLYDFAPYTPPCAWCGEYANEEQGAVELTIIAPPVEGYGDVFPEPFHKDCAATAARDMVI